MVFPSILEGESKPSGTSEWARLRDLAENYRTGHVPAVYFGALREFGRAREFVSAEQSVERAKRGAQGAANLVNEHLRQGMRSLKTIATTAPFIGLIGPPLGYWIGLEAMKEANMLKYSGFAGLQQNLC